MNTPDTWAGALALYDDALRAAHRSPTTIRLHWHYLQQLREVAPRPWAVSTAQLLRLIASRGWGPEATKSARQVYRGFYRWGHGAGYVDEDPALSLPAVKVPPGLPRPTPEHVVRQLLSVTDDRIGLMGMLMALGGLRCAEVAKLHRDDYQGTPLEGVLRVVGKGRKVRDVPVLDRRLAGRLYGLERYAFPNRDGEPMTPGHVSRLMSASLPGDWTAHTLRHRCASTAYAGTRDLLAVGALLGHSRPETTQRYVLMPDDAVRAAVRAASVA